MYLILIYLNIFNQFLRLNTFKIKYNVTYNNISTF